MQTILVALPYAFVVIVQLALVLAAFQTSIRLGLMAFFVPMYVASTGNWRLRTVHRRQLAIAWWAGLACLILSVAATSR